jgi:hypothetical protein
VQQLRGACDRLLAAAPDNAALHLLRAFTRSLSTTSSDEMFVVDFRRAWDLFREVKGLTRQEVLLGMSRFYEWVRRYDAGAVGLIETEIAATHVEWLSSLNQQLRAA